MLDRNCRSCLGFTLLRCWPSNVATAHYRLVFVECTVVCKLRIVWIYRLEAFCRGVNTFRTTLTWILARVLAVVAELAARLAGAWVSEPGVYVGGCGASYRVGSVSLLRLRVCTVGHVGLRWDFRDRVWLMGLVDGCGAWRQSLRCELWNGVIAYKFARLMLPT
jgi:hypothetical protein